MEGGPKNVSAESMNADFIRNMDCIEVDARVAERVSSA